MRALDPNGPDVIFFASVEETRPRRKHRSPGTLVVTKVDQKTKTITISAAPKKKRTP